MSLYFLFLGVILGDPKGEHVILDEQVTHVRQREVTAVETKCSSPNKMALSLLDLFFSKHQLATSLATICEGRELLDPQIISGLKCKAILFVYVYI